ncbi:hypothetical protein ATO13_22206 [Stappia sp. 22II-S9-Z10]|nr:hypothetical protein ATO13_22206 [Stappia sp. 22II-S9-Z10]
MTITDTASLVQRVSDDPTIIFSGEVSFDEFFAELRHEAKGVGQDVNKAKTRAAITSMAYRISRTKTAIDNAGKALTEDWRKKTATVNETRKKARDTLDAFKDEVRRPLDAWQAQEDARVASHEAVIVEISDAARVTMEDTAATLRGRIERLKAMDLSERELQEFAERAQAKREASVDYLTSALARAEKAEAEAEELARLRKAEAERAERERQEAEAREAKERKERQVREKAEREAREAEERREREAEISRQAELRAREAAERKIREAEEAAAREREEQERKHREEISRREEEAARKEAERAAAEEARRAEEKRQREADEARARDVAHRESVKAEAAAALTRVCGVRSELAEKIVSAICAGDVPHISIRF